jgi:hypothetical protein
LKINLKVCCNFGGLSFGGMALLGLFFSLGVYLSLFWVFVLKVFVLFRFVFVWGFGAYITGYAIA